MKTGALSLVALLIAAPASADIVTVTVTGTISPWTYDHGWSLTPLIDTGGVFDAPGGTLSGDAFSVLWTFDTGPLNEVYNGLVSARLTINDRSVTYADGVYSILRVDPNQFYANVTVVPGPLALNTFVFTAPGTFPSFNNIPFTYEVQPGDNLPPYNLGSTIPAGGGFRLNGLNGYFDVDNVALVNPLYHTPGPIVGAGLPGLVVLLLAWWRMRRREAINA